VGVWVPGWVENDASLAGARRAALNEGGRGGWVDAGKGTRRKKKNYGSEYWIMLEGPPQIG
jgi:hypothetical protein